MMILMNACGRWPGRRPASWTWGASWMNKMCIRDRPRGLSDLHRAIRNLHDEADIVGYVKQSAKLAASVGLVETCLLYTSRCV